MLNGIQHWLNDVLLTDPLQRKQARAIQIMLLGIIGAAGISMLLTLAIAPNPGGALFAIGILAGLVILQAIAITLLRRGQFHAAVMLATLGLIIILGMFAITSSLLTNPINLITFAIPLVFVGMLLGRRWLLACAGVIVLIVSTGMWLESAMPGILLPQREDTLLIRTLVGFIIVVGLLTFLLDRFGASLRESLAESYQRSQELEALRYSLEQTVAERTSLIQETINQLKRTQATVQELGVVILPVLPGVLATPLIGAIDSHRAASITERLLAAIQQMRASVVILDITGLATVDTFVARSLIQTTSAMRLLGAQPVMVGITPEVAQTIVTLGISFGEVRVFANLADAIRAIEQEHSSESRNYGSNMN